MSKSAAELKAEILRLTREFSTLIVFIAALVAFLRVEAKTVGALMPLDF